MAAMQSKLQLNEKCHIVSSLHQDRGLYILDYVVAVWCHHQVWLLSVLPPSCGTTDSNTIDSDAAEKTIKAFFGKHCKTGVTLYLVRSPQSMSQWRIAICYLNSFSMQ